MVDQGGYLLMQNLLDVEKHIDSYDWQPFREGVEMAKIYGKDEGPSAALLRYASGAIIPMHQHPGFEHILVLSGSQTDGHNVFGKGTLVVSKPGSRHRIVSETGCIVLAIWHSPVVFA